MGPGGYGLPVEKGRKEYEVPTSKGRLFERFDINIGEAKSIIYKANAQPKWEKPNISFLSVLQMR